MRDFSKQKNSTLLSLKRIRFRLFRLHRQYARMKTLERKQDTRRKIQLGGLIKKAGLQDESTAVLLGLLLDAAETLQSDAGQSVRNNWRIKGDIQLTSEQTDSEFSN